MTIIKIQKEDRKNFFFINRTVLEIENLSWEAKGLWTYLMSKPDDWDVSVVHLCNHFPSGRDKIYRLLNELVNHGLCEREQPFIKDKDGKLFKGKIQTTVYELPQKHLLEKIQKKILVPENPEAEKPEADFTTQVKNDSTKEGDEEKESSLKRAKEKSAAPSFSPRETKERFIDHVFLTKEEHQKLLEKFGAAKTALYIEKLDAYVGSKGKKYKSHYKTIVGWILKDEIPKTSSQNEEKKGRTVKWGRKDL